MVNKYLFKIICMVCLFISMLMFIISPWVKFSGIKKSDLKELKQEAKESFEEMSDRLTSDYILDELDDLGIELKKSDIKKMVSNMKELVDDALKLQGNPFTVTNYSFKIRSFVNFAEKIADEDYLLRMSGMRDLEDAIEPIKVGLIVSYVYTAIMLIILLFGVLGIVFAYKGKKGFTITYFVLSTIYVFLFTGVTIAANIILHAEADMPSRYSVSVSYGGIIAFVMALVALIMICIDSKKNKPAVNPYAQVNDGFYANPTM